MDSYGVPAEPTPGDIQRKLRDLERQVGWLRADKAQWRTTMGDMISATVRDTVAATPSLQSRSSGGAATGPTSKSSPMAPPVDGGERLQAPDLASVEAWYNRHLDALEDAVAVLEHRGGASASLNASGVGSSESSARVSPQSSRSATPRRTAMPSSNATVPEDQQETLSASPAGSLLPSAGVPPGPLLPGPMLPGADASMSPSPHITGDAKGVLEAMRAMGSSANKAQMATRRFTMAQKVAKSTADMQMTGWSERHPIMAAMDLLFVVASIVACASCIALTHRVGRQSDFAEGTGAFNATVAGLVAVEVFTIGFVVSRFLLSRRRGDWDVIDTLELIRKKYVSGWFAVDVLIALPVELVFYGWWWDAYRWASVRHFLRVPRIVSLGTSNNPLLASRVWFRFVSVLAFMMLLVGVMGAVFWDLEPHYKFEESAYWAIASVTSVGYGDIVPLTVRGKLFACGGMFVGIMALSTVTAFATSYVTYKDSVTEEEEVLKETMDSMLVHYEVPWPVQKEVIAAMEGVIARQHETRFSVVVDKLPSFVAVKLRSYIAAKMLRNVPAFKHGVTDTATLAELGRLLQRVAHRADEDIHRRGTVLERLIILSSGTAVKLQAVDRDSQREAVVEVLHTGSFIGEMALVGDVMERSGREPYSYRTLERCETLQLSREDFDVFVGQHYTEGARVRGLLRNDRSSSTNFAFASLRSNQMHQE